MRTYRQWLGEHAAMTALECDVPLAEAAYCWQDTAAHYADWLAECRERMEAGGEWSPQAWASLTHSQQYDIQKHCAPRDAVAPATSPRYRK